MSQLPPPYDPLPYASAGMRMPSPRPKSVTVIAIIGIIFGALGVLGALCNLPQYMGVKILPNPVMDAMREDSVLVALIVGSLVISLIASVLLLWGGIGALSLKPGARKALIAYAIVLIVNTIVGLGLSLTVSGTRSEAAFQRSMKNVPPAQAAAMQKGYELGFYGATGFSVIFLVWPGLVLYYMSRPHVKAAFEQAMPRRG